jgi:hypothetical protein
MEFSVVFHDSLGEPDLSLFTGRDIAAPAAGEYCCLPIAD